MSIETALPGLKEILVAEGMDFERFRGLDPHEQFAYFTGEFLETAVHAEEMKDLFLESEGDMMVFSARLWASHNPGHPFAKKIVKEVKKQEKLRAKMIKDAEKASKKGEKK